ncbi:MAG: hypothetical protein WA750_10230 [Pseudolabrys sp.]
MSAHDARGLFADWGAIHARGTLHFCDFVRVYWRLLRQDDKSKRQKEKPIQLPSFDFNGYSGRLTADQSRIWETPDPTSQFQTRQSASQPYFGLTLSRPLQ